MICDKNKETYPDWIIFSIEENLVGEIYIFLQTEMFDHVSLEFYNNIFWRNILRDDDDMNIICSNGRRHGKWLIESLKLMLANGLAAEELRLYTRTGERSSFLDKSKFSTFLGLPDAL